MSEGGACLEGIEGGLLTDKEDREGVMVSDFEDEIGPSVKVGGMFSVWHGKEDEPLHFLRRGREIAPEDTFIGIVDDGFPFFADDMFGEVRFGPSEYDGIGELFFGGASDSVWDIGIDDGGEVMGFWVEFAVERFLDIFADHPDIFLRIF